MSPNERWLSALWSFVGAKLPAPAATVIEIGCGPRGGFVPAMRGAGYEATGVDPKAPDGADYHQVEFERYDVDVPVDAIVACTSLHHVADLDDVLDRVATALRPGGTLIVVEWAWERFDEMSARWCFERLSAPAPPTEPGWLHRHYERWLESGQPWDRYFRSWAEEEKLHPGAAILQALDGRFARREAAYKPYFFSDLAGISEGSEQQAIDAGEIIATGIRYVGARLPQAPDPVSSGTERERKRGLPHEDEGTP
jgi:SAM-dependent methyltransferase